MDLKELNRYLDLREKINKANETLESLRASATPRAAAITGLPHTPGVSDKVGNLAIEIAYLESSIAGLTEEMKQLQSKIVEFISGIHDHYLVTIFRLRFIHSLPWSEVAHIMGGGNSEGGVKAACYRYLKKCNGVSRRDA